MLRKVKFINSLTVFFLILFMAALVFLVLVSEPWYESPKTGGRAWYMYIKTWNYLQMHFLVVILTSFGVRWKVGCSQVWLRETSLCGGSCLPELDPKCLLHSKGRRKRVPQLRESWGSKEHGHQSTYLVSTTFSWGFPDGSNSKQSACNVGDLGSTPGWGGKSNDIPFFFSLEVWNKWPLYNTHNYFLLSKFQVAHIQPQSRMRIWKIAAMRNRLWTAPCMPGSWLPR